MHSAFIVMNLQFLHMTVTSHVEPLQQSTLLPEILIVVFLEYLTSIAIIKIINLFWFTLEIAQLQPRVWYAVCVLCLWIQASMLVCVGELYDCSYACYRYLIFMLRCPLFLPSQSIRRCVNVELLLCRKQELTTAVFID